MAYSCSNYVSSKLNYTTCQDGTIGMRRERRASTIHNVCPDIWEEIFEYFNPADLYTTFTSINTTIDEILYDHNNQYLLKRLTLGFDVTVMPRCIPLTRVASLTLHETVDVQFIESCSQLRSLKIIGDVQWIICVVEKIAQTHLRLTQIHIETPMIKSLSKLLMPILAIPTLYHLEIHTDSVDDQKNMCSSIMMLNRILQLTFDTCSMNDDDSLQCILSYFVNVHKLSIGLIDQNQQVMTSMIFHTLHTLRLNLFETSFDLIIQLVTAMPCLQYLKLIGRAVDQGYVVDQRWTELLNAAPSLRRILVNIHFQRSLRSQRDEKIQASLGALNLHFTLDFDETVCNLYEDQQQNQWWTLKGIIIKHEHSF